MRILFIQTGGTIDKDYPHTTKGWAFEFGEPATKRLLERLDPSFKYEILTAFQKDSLEITNADRDQLVQLIRQYPQEKIIITPNRKRALVSWVFNIMCRFGYSLFQTSNL